MKTRSQTKQAKNGREQYNPSVRERRGGEKKKRKKTQQTKTSLGKWASLAPALHLSLPPSHLSNRAWSSQPGRSASRRVTAVHRPGVTAPGMRHLHRTAPARGPGLFPPPQHGLAQHSAQILPSSLSFGCLRKGWEKGEGGESSK